MRDPALPADRQLWAALQRTLAAYDAALTEFDKPTQSGMMAPDRSTGSLTVSYVSSMNDTNFDRLLQEIHFKQF